MSTDQQPLEQRLRIVEQRLEALERALSAGLQAQPATAPVGETTAAGALLETSSLVSAAGQIGRTLIVLGGAFLLRFMTQSAMLPQLSGTAVGILYALVWVYFADRAARQGAYESATFHGVSAAAIGFPLLWETTLKFQYLTPIQSAAAVGIFTALPLAVAWRREMRSFAVVIAAPAAVTMLALGFATGTLPPFVAGLLVLGFASLLLTYNLEWYVLGVSVALVADFAIALATAVWLYRPQDGAAASLGAAGLSAAQVALGAVYFGTFSFLALRRKRNLSLAEIAQTAVVLIIGLGGFVGTSSRLATASPLLGLGTLLLAAASYVVAYSLMDEAPSLNRTFVVYSSVAAASTLVATHLSFDGTALGIVLASSALVCAAGGTWRNAPSLSLHGAAYILAAAVAADLVGADCRALWGSGRLAEMLTSSAPWVVFLVSMAISLLPSSNVVGAEQRLRKSRLPAMLLTSATLAALAVALSLGFGSENNDADLIRSSIVRSTVISGGAVALALLSRRLRFASSRWLVAAFLLLGVGKLIAQDLPSGEPSILFGSLAAFGAALVIAPRLLNGGVKSAAKTGPSTDRAAEYSA